MDNRELLDKFYDLMEVIAQELINFSDETGIPIDEIEIVRYHNMENETTSYYVNSISAEKLINKLEK